MGRFDRYQKSLKGNPDLVAQARRKQNETVNEIAFTMADGYKLAKLQTRQHYDQDIEQWEDFEILIKHALNEKEKKLATRPRVNLPIGSYLKYEDSLENGETEDTTIIIKGQTLGKGEVMPTYKAYVCNHMLKLKGCPFQFPISSSNTSYSAKGILDADLLNIIDNRNKFYIQRNKYTVRLFQHHKNYRIALGDEEITYYYTIANMDDTSTSGMFTVTLLEDEKSHLDGEYAYNENEIDYSDLIDKEDEEGNVIEGQPLPIINCNTYQYVGKPFNLISNVPMVSYELSSGLEEVEITEDDMVLTIKPIEVGLQKITITDKFGQQATKNIMVK